MIVEKTARELVPGDMFSNNGAEVIQVVPCGNGRSTYIQAQFEDGYVQVVTVPADQVIPCYRPDPAIRSDVTIYGAGGA